MDTQRIIFYQVLFLTHCLREGSLGSSMSTLSSMLRDFSRFVNRTTLNTRSEVTVLMQTKVDTTLPVWRYRLPVSANIIAFKVLDSPHLRAASHTEHATEPSSTRTHRVLQLKATTLLCSRYNEADEHGKWSMKQCSATSATPDRTS